MTEKNSIVRIVRTETIVIRVTKDEHAKIKKFALKAKESISSYYRNLLMNHVNEASNAKR